MNPMHRREFLSTTGKIVGVQVAASGLLSAAPSEHVDVGFIGVGGRGTRLLTNLLQISGFRVRAICDIDPAHVSRAQKLVEDAGQPRPAGTAAWKSLLERKDVQAVVSALPCDLHAEAYLDVITSGRDLYGEKPMCLTVKDCDAVVAATKKHDRIVQIGFQRRSDPRFIETIQQVHAGELGRLLEGRVLWSNSWGPLYGWFGLRERSGDWMVEQAVHNWDVMNWANRCLPVRAMGLGHDDLFREKQPDRNVHDYYSGVVQYDNGVIVNIIHSWTAPTLFNKEYTRLIGLRGGIDFNSGTFSYRPRLKKPDRVGHDESGPINSTRLALENFLSSVRSRKQPVATVEHGRDAVLACLLMRRAVYEGSPATMEDLVK